MPRHCRLVTIMKAKQILDEVNVLKGEWDYLVALARGLADEDAEVDTLVLHNYRGAMRRIAYVATTAREKTLNR